MNISTILRVAVVAGVVAVAGAFSAARAQGFSIQVSVGDGPPVMAAEPAAPDQLADDQLDQMLGPVALFPDPLLAQILPAATYPMDIVQAAQWLAANPQADDQTIDQQDWEPSVKAVAHYPTVLQMLADHVDWTQALGAAFLNQQSDVMESVQRLRQQALAAGTLETTPEQQVIEDDDSVEILPASPDIIYVPLYDPYEVYERHEGEHRLRFEKGFRIGDWLAGCFDWRDRWVAVGGGWHEGWRYEDHRWHPDERRGDYHEERGAAVTRFRHTNPVPAYRQEATLSRPWAHDAAKPRPSLPPALVKPNWSNHNGWAGPGQQQAPPPGAQRKPFALPVTSQSPRPVAAAPAAQGAMQRTNVMAPPSAAAPQPLPPQGGQPHVANAPPAAPAAQHAAQQNVTHVTPSAAPASATNALSGYESRGEAQRSADRARQNLAAHAAAAPAPALAPAAAVHVAPPAPAPAPAAVHVAPPAAAPAPVHVAPAAAPAPVHVAPAAPAPAVAPVHVAPAAAPVYVAPPAGRAYTPPAPAARAAPAGAAPVFGTQDSPQDVQAHSDRGHQSMRR